MARTNIITHPAHALLFFALVIIVSVILSSIVFRRRDAIDILFPASNLFIAFIVAAGALHYKFMLSMHTVSMIFFAAVAISLICAAMLGKECLPKRISPLSTTAALIIIVAMSAALRILMMWHTQYPLGNDTYFHCLYSKSIMQAGRLVFTMMPYDPMPLRYPWGMHTALAFTSEISGAPIHAIFKFAMIFWSCSAVAGLFALTRQFTGSGKQALWAAAFYGLTANFGSIDYIRWGGLGNVLTMCALISLVSSAECKSVRKPAAALFQVLLIFSSFMIHGSAALVPIVIFVCVSAALAASGENRSSIAISSITSSAVALLICRLTAPDIFQHLGGLGSSAALSAERYVSITDFPLMFGVVFSSAAIFGFVIMTKRYSTGAAAAFTWTALLILGFLASRYAFGIFSYLKTGAASIAFLPSRFATDLVYPASIFAGCAADYALNTIGKSLNYIIKPLIIAAFAALFISAPAQHIVDKWGQSYAGPAEIAAMNTLSRTAPPGSLVLNKESARGSYWVPYATGLVSTTISRPMLHHLNYDAGADAVKIIESRSALNNILFLNRDFTLFGQIIDGHPETLFFAYTDEPIHWHRAALVSRSGGIYIYRLK